jgi:ElaB/YqjD/DUF883 family membrane-anchored ribosome-binding protein
MTDHERMGAGDEFEPSAAGAAGTDREASGSNSPAEIEREIEQTRARMSENIDTISEKLRPGNLAQSAVESVGEQARHTGSRLANVIRENPIPVAAIGLGVTWLVAQQRSKRGLARYGYRGPERRISGYSERRRGLGTRSGATAGATREPATGMAERVEGMAEGIGDVAERAQERMSELGSEAKERMQQFGSRAREQTHRVGARLERMIDQNPLVVAAGAVVVGLAAGLLLPGTRREDELMGSARDQLMERAGDTVERVKEAAGEAAREVTETVTEQAKESASRVSEATKEALKEQTGGMTQAPRRRPD